MASTKKDQNKNTFESSLQRLEEIVELLEQSNIPLDEALKLYEEGVVLSQTCADKLQQAELKIKKLSKSSNGGFQSLNQNDERLSHE